MDPGDEQHVSVEPALDALVEVWDPEDRGRRQVFAEIPRAVGVPGVHLLWRLLAGSPLFLLPAWPSFAESLTSTSLRAVAAELIEGSFLADAAGRPSHKAFRGDLVRAEIDAELRERIEHFNDLSQLGVARLLALAAAMREGAYGRAGVVPPAVAPRADPAPPGAYVAPLRRGEERGKAAEVLARLEREHHLPFLDDYYRSLARIPDYLSAAWNAIRPIVGDPVYIDLAARLTARAREQAGSQGAAAAALQAIDACEPSVRGVVRLVLDLCVDAVLPQTLIDITLIKALTSGPDRATSRTF